MATFKIKGKKISVHSDGLIFVDGMSTRIRQWDCGNRYSNPSGQEIKDLKGMSLQDALYFKGLLSR